MNLEPLPSPLSIPLYPPEWADVFGEDDFGVFASFRLGDVSFPLRWIPPGRFRMGSPPDEAGRDANEGPQHWVTLSRGFWLGETPVTQDQWLAVLRHNYSRFRAAEFSADQYPVDQISDNDCIRFVRELNRTVPGLGAGLPTEAQWEYACRAGSEGAYHDGSRCTEPTGNDRALARLGWFKANSGESTHPVGTKAPNQWGLYDMHGNVWEWCRDGERKYEGDVTDPIGPIGEKIPRVIRGGSWDDPARACRAAYRFPLWVMLREMYLGFRVSAGQEPGAAEPPGTESRWG